MGFCKPAEYVDVDESYRQLEGKDIIGVDPKYFRPAEVTTLLGDASYAHQKLGWEPETTFEALVTEMTKSDYLKFRR